MLHVITEVGKPGKKERERRHFPLVHNAKSEPLYKPHGRKYIAHNYGTDIDWVPHGQYIDHEPTESGPDWTSRLRYIPDPENPDYPAAEIWPNNWKSMRPFPCQLVQLLRQFQIHPVHTLVGSTGHNILQGHPQFLAENNKNNNGLDIGTHGETSDAAVAVNRPDDGEKGYAPKELNIFGDRGKKKGPWTYMRSRTEWLLDPSVTRIGRRCVWDGEHRATATSHDEITHSALYGRARPEWLIDKRNSIPGKSLGDKPYQVPEYSSSFHKHGSTRPLARYGPFRPFGTWNTFIPLTPVCGAQRKSFKTKDRNKQQDHEIDEVRQLETWQPAVPLLQTLPSVEEKK